MKSLLVILLSFILNVYAIEINEKQAKKITKCNSYTINNPSYLWHLFASSNFNFKFWQLKPNDVALECDPFEDNQISCRMINDSDKSFGSHIMGSVRFTSKNGKFENITYDLENPILLTYNPIWKDIVISVYDNPKRSYIQMSQKAFLYNAPNENAKSDKFLIKDDCALVVKKTKDWYLVYFHHNRLKTDTLMWMKAQDVLK